MDHVRLHSCCVEERWTRWTEPSAKYVDYAFNVLGCLDVYLCILHVRDHAAVLNPTYDFADLQGLATSRHALITTARGFVFITLLCCAGHEPVHFLQGRIFPTQRSSRTVQAVITERSWSPPSTSGRVNNLNGNIAWKEQLISRDEERQGVTSGVLKAFLHLQLFEKLGYRGYASSILLRFCTLIRK